MRLLLIRHGIAVERGTPGYEVDATRPLTDEGRKKFGRVSQRLKAWGLSPDRIIASPYKRALQTAEILGKEVGVAVELDERLEPGKDPSSLVDRVSRQQTVALVGHEPDLSDLASRLVRGSTGAIWGLKKGGLCCLRWDGPLACLELLLSPKVMLG